MFFEREPVLPHKDVLPRIRSRDNDHATRMLQYLTRQHFPTGSPDLAIDQPDRPLGKDHLFLEHTIFFLRHMENRPADGGPCLDYSMKNWSGIRESNPSQQLGKLPHYHYANPA